MESPVTDAIAQRLVERGLCDTRAIERARQILAQHEDFVPKEAPVQIQLFEPVNHELADRIRKLNVDQLRPIEALQLLSDLQKELKN